MKKRFAMLLATAMLLSGCGAEKPAANIPETTLAAENQAGTEPEETIPATTEAAFDLTTWQGNYDLGLSYADSKEWKLAYDAFDAAVALDPQQPDAYARRGLARVCLEETEENLSLSCEDYQQALALDEGCALAYRGIADVHIRRGEYDEAEDVIKDAWEKTNQDPALNGVVKNLEHGVFVDSSGRPRYSRETFYNSQGEHCGWLITEYDDNGNQISVESFDSNGKSTGFVEISTVTKDNVTVDINCGIGITQNKVVVSKRVTTTTTNPDGSYDVLEESFDANGKKGSYGHNFYDAQGQLTYFESYDKTGNMDYYATFEYDSDGKQIRSDHYNPDGTLREYNTFDYDVNGNISTSYLYDGNDVLLHYTVNLYDEQGHRIGWETYDGSGNLTYTHMFE